MPLYEYQCLKCEVLHEVMQKFSDPPLEVCPSCGAEVAKVMSLSSFSLKGSGWYTTDYKRAPKASQAPDLTPKTTSPDSGVQGAAAKTETPTTAPKPEKSSVPSSA